jgi:hypothetical protein
MSAKAASSQGALRSLPWVPATTSTLPAVPGPATPPETSVAAAVALASITPPGPIGPQPDAESYAQAAA